MKICFKKSQNLYTEFILWFQSFTSMKADLHQETNGGFTRSMCLKWITFLKKVPHKGLGKLTQKRTFVFITLLIWFYLLMCLTEQFLQQKCSIKKVLNDQALIGTQVVGILTWKKHIHELAIGCTCTQFFHFAILGH